MLDSRFSIFDTGSLALDTPPTGGGAKQTCYSQIRKVSRKAVPEIIHRAVVFGTNSFVGNINAEKDFDVIFKVPLCARPSTPKLRVNVRCLFDVDGNWRRN
jgi:hypothetical protein